MKMKMQKHKQKKKMKMKMKMKTKTMKSSWQGQTNSWWDCPWTTSRLSLSLSLCGFSVIDPTTHRSACRSYIYIRTNTPYAYVYVVHAYNLHITYVDVRMHNMHTHTQRSRICAMYIRVCLRVCRTRVQSTHNVCGCTHA
jgi:hypothetical protein